jgi:1-acyl-sn-glycerol-3-phosphate acyltransferase
LELPADDPRPSLDYPLYETRLHKAIVWLARKLFTVFVDMEVNGLENLPASGAAVITANHLVMYDVFPLQLALPRMIFYMGKAELFQVGFIHAIFRQMGAFPVYRGERDLWAMDHALKILGAGQLVAMFPEGTRSKGKGLALARPGAAKLAIETGCPLVVVSVDGIQKLFKTFPRRTHVNLVVAAPIFPARGDSPLSLTDTMMFTMAKNLPPELRGVYSDVPKGF